MVAPSDLQRWAPWPLDPPERQDKQYQSERGDVTAEHESGDVLNTRRGILGEGAVGGGGERTIPLSAAHLVPHDVAILRPEVEKHSVVGLRREERNPRRVPRPKEVGVKLEVRVNGLWRRQQPGGG